MRVTKSYIREVRKGIRTGLSRTPEQEELLYGLGINPDLFAGEDRVRYIHDQLDGKLRKLTRKKK